MSWQGGDNAGVWDLICGKGKHHIPQVLEMPFDTAINYVAVSPSGRDLCCVGDNHTVYLCSRLQTGDWAPAR